MYGATTSVRNFSLSCGPRQATFYQDKQLFGIFSLFHITQFVKASGQASFSGKFRSLVDDLEKLGQGQSDLENFQFGISL